MALKRVKNGWQVLVYDPAVKRKVYAGTREKWGDAKDLERDEIKARRKAHKSTEPESSVTIREYATGWLDERHGEGTRRPAKSTRQVNAGNLRPFLKEFGDRAIDGGVTRREALKWAAANPTKAKSVSAMFNDAVDEEESKANPFAKRGQEESRGRRDIHPMTEQEVELLAGIAEARWGKDGYGLVAKAWVLFGAWVGPRPGETFGVTERDLDLINGLVRVHRVKGRKQTEWVVLPRAVQDAIVQMPRISNPMNLLFPTASGLRMRKWQQRYYWDPIRSAFQQKISADRWVDLIEGQDNLDFYSCRHFCASIIVARGGNEYDVAAQLGNTPEEARKTYIHSYEDRQRDRLRGLLDQPAAVDLAAVRAERMGSRDG